MSEVKTPTTKEDADVLEKALSGYKAARIDAARQIFEGPIGKKFLDAVDTLIAEGLPVGCATQSNVAQIPQWFKSMKNGIASDFALFDGIANPPADDTGSEAPGVPLV